MPPPQKSIHAGLVAAGDRFNIDEITPTECSRPHPSLSQSRSSAAALHQKNVRSATVSTSSSSSSRLLLPWPVGQIPQATFWLTIFLDDSASADLFRRFIYIAVNFMNISTRVFYFLE